MATGVRAKAYRRPKRGGESYSRECLERLARILVDTGHSPQGLMREFRAICSALKEPSRRWDPTHLAYLADIPHVIAHWHADPQYLDSRGLPVPLPLRGRGTSLCTLIERVLPREDPMAVARSLTRLHGVRRRQGQYVPSGRYFIYPPASGWVHGLTALLGMLRTVERNVTGPKSSAILQRAALNPSFPVSALPAFHRRLKALAEEILWNVDGDMRRHEAEDPAGPRVRLGVGVFAFEEPLAKSRVSGRALTRRGRSRMKPRGTRK
jgi:uncharacterized protein DUF6502